MKKLSYLMFVLLIAGTMNLTAQVKIGGNANDPTETVNGSSVLELQSDPVAKKGLLLPRVAITDLNVWGMADDVQQDGMMVYNTTPGSEGPYYWTGGVSGKWNAMKTSASVNNVTGPEKCDGGILAPNGAYIQNGGTADIASFSGGVFWYGIQGAFTADPGTALCVYKRDAATNVNYKMTWQEALDGCKNSTPGFIDVEDASKGYEWRLPNIAELAQIETMAIYYGLNNKWASGENHYWSSTGSSDTSAWIWTYKYPGSTLYNSASTSAKTAFSYVRCVRDIQLLDK